MPNELRSLDFLEQPFRDHCVALLATVWHAGWDMRPTTTIRSPWQQSRAWRSGRSRVVILDRVASLREADADYLADVILEVGPQMSELVVTNAIPGFSHHQTGQAMDATLFIDGAPVWDGDHAGYRVYADTARGLGLFTIANDAPHVQARQEGRPGGSVGQISEEMRLRFGTVESEWLARVAL